MRSDLRRELPMAEEAFALSPISARASLPSEADYDAIREAFMETARGRWFLNEYTKRNRNADTDMVLEAVTRMEASLAAQKQAAAGVSLIEALGAIRTAIRQAKVTAAEAMPRADDDASLVAARNGVRIVREIAWSLRECGADVRICDLLDAQVKAIEADQQHAATADSRLAVLASFDVLVQRIEQISTGDVVQPAAAPVPSAEPAAEKREASVTPLFRTATDVSEAIAEPLVPVEATMPSAVAEATVETTATAASEAIATAMADMLQEAAHEASAAVEPDAVAHVEPAVVAPLLPETVGFDAEAAQDLAVLDMVAMEMAAPDESGSFEPESALPEMIAPDLAGPEMIEPAAAMHAIETMAAPVAEAPAPSLGAALIASGVISNPHAPASDPLAPIRRMSQVEKIAFFS
jgi:hypothetical protein